MHQPFDPYDHIHDIMHDPAVFSLDIDARLDAISKYPSWKQNTFLVLGAEGMIGNGGTPGIFCNDGCIVPRTIEAYEAIGAPDHAAWLRKLMAYFGDPYPMNIDEINERLSDTPEEIWDESSRFFFDDRNSSRIDELLAAQCPASSP